MAVNTVSSVGGPLSMEMVLDDSSISATKASIEKDLNDIAETAVQASKKQTDALKDVVTAYQLIRKTGLEGGGEVLELLKAEAKAAENLGVGYDKSKQELIDYLEAVKQLSREGVAEAAQPTAAPTAVTPAAGLDQSLKQLIDESQQAFDKLDEQTKKYILDLIKVQQQLNEVESAQSALDDELKNGNVSIEDYNKATVSLALKSKNLSDSFTDLTESHKKYQAVQDATSGSINQKRILLQQLKQQYDSLSESERNSVGTGTALKENIIQLENEIKNLSSNLDETQTAFARLREIKAQLADLKPGDIGFNELLAEASKLENKIKDVSSAIKLASSTTSKIDALTQSVRGVVGGFAAWQGALGVLNIANKDVEKNIQLLVSAMAVLNGVQEVAQVLDKNSALNTFLLAQMRKTAAVATTEQAVATEAVAAAEGAEAVAATGATAATEGLTVAMEANPAGILLLALTAVVIAVQSYISSIKDATEQQTELNNAIAEANGVLEKLIELQAEAATERTREAEKAVSLAQAQGKSEKEITALRIESLRATIRENTLKAASFGITEQQHKENKAALEIRLEELEALKNAKSTDEERLALVKSQVDVLQGLVNAGTGFFNAIKDANAKIQDEVAAANKKAADDALKSSADLAQARVIIAKKGSQEELDAKIASINAQRKVELNDVNITKGTIAKINADANKQIEEAKNEFTILLLTNQRELIQTRLNAAKVGSAEELRLRLALIEKTAEIELAAFQISDEKKKSINSKRIKDEEEIIKQASLQDAEGNLNVEISNINTRLAAVQAGTEKELQLKKDLVDKQADLDTIKVSQSIKNEELLAAKVLEIEAESLAKKKKLEDDFADKSLKSKLKIIKDDTEKLNSSLQGLVDSGTVLQSFRARKFQLQNDLDGLNKSLTLVRANLKAGKGDFNKLTEQASDLEKEIKKDKEALDVLGKGLNKNLLAELEKDINEIGGSLNNLASQFRGLNEEIADNLAKLASTVQAAAGAMASFGKAKEAFKAGDFASGVKSSVDSISGLVAVVSAIANTIKANNQSEREARQAVLDFQTRIIAGELELNATIRERQREQVFANKTRKQGLEDENKLLREQKDINKKAFDDLIAQIQKESFITNTKAKKGSIIGQILGGPLDLFGSQKTKVEQELASLAGKSFEDLEKLFTQGQLTDKAKELFLQLQKIKEEGVDIDAMLAENAENARQFFTGTTAESITSTIIQGFKDGKRAVSDFADDMEDIIRGAMLRAIEIQTLTEPIKAIFEKFAADAESGGVLDENEVKTFHDSINKALQNAVDFAEQVEKATGVNLSEAAEATSKQNSLSGRIQGIREDQADVLAGRLGGIQVSAVRQVSIALQHLTVLNNIKGDTAYLINIDKRLKNLEDNGIKIK